MKRFRKHMLVLTFVCVTLVATLGFSTRGKAVINYCDYVCLPINLVAFDVWFMEVFFKDNLLRAMMMMTEQMNAVAIDQLMIIGTFFDAKHQLETQRLFQELEVQAQRDYQPSEDFCLFGTNTRSLGASEQISRYNKVALAARQMGRHLGNKNVAGSLTRDQDKETRWAQFWNRYCDPKDNNWRADKAASGLTVACGPGGGNTRLINLDIDYTRLVDEPRTLDIAFQKGAPTPLPPPNLEDAPLSVTAEANPPGPNEQDVIAMGNNLYGNDVLTRNIDADYLANPANQDDYLKLRSVAAKRSVAENSFNSIVAMKAYGSSDDPEKEYTPADLSNNDTPHTRQFLARIMVDLGVPKDQVFDMIGLRPSYYAQLEILAKKVYQNPGFYANLYDTPANVARKSVAMKAIELMLDREMYESQLRREMTISVLLSTRLRKEFRDVNKDMPGANGS